MGRKRAHKAKHISGTFKLRNKQCQQEQQQQQQLWQVLIHKRGPGQVGVRGTRAEISFTCLFFMRTIRFVCFVSMSMLLCPNWSWLRPLKLTVPQKESIAI